MPGLKCNLPILVLPPHSHCMPPGCLGGPCVILEMHHLLREAYTAADFKGKGYGKAFYSNIFLPLEDITFQENYEISHAEPGSAQCSLIRLLWLYVSQQEYFYNIDGSQLLMQSSCSYSGVHPHNGFQGLVHITVMGSLLGLPRHPAQPCQGAHLSHVFCFSHFFM